MGNKEGKKTNTLIDQERNRQLQETSQAKSYLQPERMAEKGFADSLRGDIVSGYKSLYGDPNSSTSSGGGGGGGGYVAPQFSLDPRFNELEAGYKPLSEGINKALPGYEEFAKTGGLTDEIRDRIRGKGVFDEFSQTGGYTDRDIAQTRARGIAPVGAFYGNLKNELARRKGVSGGYGAGFDTASAKMARDAATAGTTAARETELGLQGAIRGNRFQGAQALSGAETEYAKLLQGGRLSGLGGMTDIGKFGYAGLEGIADRAQQISNANAQAAASASNANSSASAEDQRYRDRMKLAGLAGLQDVYGANPAELARYDDELYRQQALTQQGQAGNLNLRAQYNPNVSAWDRALQIGGVAAGVGSAALGVPRTNTGVAGPFSGSPSYWQ